MKRRSRTGSKRLFSNRKCGLYIIDK
jgi:hypothetical protein